MLLTFDKDAHTLDGDRARLVYSAAQKLQIKLLDGGQLYELQDNESLRIVIKPDLKFDSGVELFTDVFRAADFLSEPKVLQRIVNLVTVPMQAALKDNGNSADDLPSIRVNIAVGFRTSDEAAASWSEPFSIEIVNTPGRDGDGTPQGVPTPAAGWMQQPCTALTGSASGSLDAVITANDAVPTGNIRMAFADSELSFWRLSEGTDAEDASAGFVRPDDYDDTDNARVWIRIS